VTLSLAHHHESLYRNPKPKSSPPRDSLITASDLLSDLQVETYSSMERVEKTKFILEQMRLLLEVARLKDAESSKAGKGDKGALNGGEPEWVKLRVQSRKVNEQFLKEPENEVCCIRTIFDLSFSKDVVQQSIKLQFYDMMVQYGLHHHAYLDVAKYYHKVWETPSIKEDVSDKGKTVSFDLSYFPIELDLYVSSRHLNTLFTMLLLLHTTMNSLT
jgi:26S proteasome regulatory subunit N5